MLASMAKGPSLLQPRPLSRAHARTLRLCAQAHAGGQGRRRRGDQPRRHRRAAHRALREAAARSRLPFRRSPDARGQDPGRHAVADLGILHGALDHQFQAAARRRGRVAGWPRALRGDQRPRQIRRPRAQSRRAHHARHHRAEHARAAARPRHEAGLADRAAKRAAAALRRALAGRGRARATAARARSRSACTTAASCRWRCRSMSRPTRCTSTT